MHQDTSQQRDLCQTLASWMCCTLKQNLDDNVQQIHQTTTAALHISTHVTVRQLSCATVYLIILFFIHSFLAIHMPNQSYIKVIFYLKCIKDWTQIDLQNVAVGLCPNMNCVLVHLSQDILTSSWMYTCISIVDHSSRSWNLHFIRHHFPMSAPSL